MNFEAEFRRLGGIRPIGGRSFQPMPEADIQYIEKEMCVMLPNTYRQLLSNFGAFSFKGESEDNPFVIFRSLEPLPPHISSDNTGLFNAFYGVSADEDDPWGISVRLSFYTGRIPSTMIPIADAWDNQICLGITGEDYGRVYLWDLDAEEYQDEDGPHGTSQVTDGHDLKRKNLTLIAESFEDFLARLEFCKD